MRALPSVPNARIVVGVTDTGLAAAGLDGKSHWSHAGRAHLAPIIAGNLVIVAEGDQIVALDASSGAKVWSIGNRGLASARRRATTARARRSCSLTRKRAYFSAFRASGAPLGSAETASAASACPQRAAASRFVPWSNQYVSAIDMRERRRERAPADARASEPRAELRRAAVFR